MTAFFNQRGYSATAEGFIPEASGRLKRRRRAASKRARLARRRNRR